MVFAGDVDPLPSSKMFKDVQSFELLPILGPSHDKRAGTAGNKKTQQ